MPLFVCDKCHGIDNSACGGNYWDRLLKDGLKETSGMILCAECYTGIWHNQFAKVIYKGPPEHRPSDFEYIPASLKRHNCSPS